MTALHGARVGLLEARRAPELAALVRRHGGRPVCAPAVVEESLDLSQALPRVLGWLGEGDDEMAVFLTGSGVDALWQEAERLGVEKALYGALACSTIVCRGPKPAVRLRARGLPVHVTVPPPHTTAELLRVLEPYDLARPLLLLHDGGRNQALADALRGRGARLLELQPYAWRLPEDAGPLERLVEQLAAGDVDAVAFTSQVQVQHLFQVAHACGRESALREALAERVRVGSVGPTCSAALRSLGLPVHVEASPPRMKPLVLALGEALARPGTVAADLGRGRASR